MKRTLLIILGVIGAAGLASVQAQLINVQFTGNSVGVAYGGGGVPTLPMTGLALIPPPIGSALDIWNTIPDSALTFSAYPNGASATGLALNYANNILSPVTLSLSGNNTWDNNGTFGSVEPAAGGPYGNLFSSLISAASGGALGTMDFAGLVPNAQYELVVYSAGNSAGRTSSFTIGGTTLTSTYDDVTTTLVPGVDYVDFMVSSDALGNLDLTFTAGAGSPEGDINGMQLIQVVPEPGTFALVGAGLGLLLGYQRRKALRA